MEHIIQQIRQELEEAAHIDSNINDSGWLITSVVRAISKKSFNKVKHIDKSQLFDLCEILLESGVWTERVIAFDWAFQWRKHFEKTDFERFEQWLTNYVHDWGSCDDFCTHAFGSLICQYPECLTNVMRWTASANRWFRRAAAVVMIYSVKRGEHVKEAFQIADKLLTDQDDMVQKGYGWMLKVISNNDPISVFKYVMKNKAGMPRTSLRYAIEKLEFSLRKQAMVK
jgi:3-methyladenine DNA glycosylase AlkD